MGFWYLIEDVGTIGQAFCAALQEELGYYYRLMAVLETQVHNSIPFMSNEEQGNRGGNYLSLRRLAVWLAETLMRMRLMAVLVDDCKTLRGGFIPDSLAQSVLRIGKSINFLRVCCEDQGWAKAAIAAVASVQASGNGDRGLGYGETNAMETLVVEATRRIDRHLIEILYNQYKFRDQCLAIKRCMLLGQRDLIQYLMDLLGPELLMPANTFSSFKLFGTLESAVNAC